MRQIDRETMVGAAGLEPATLGLEVVKPPRHPVIPGDFRCPKQGYVTIHVTPAKLWPGRAYLCEILHPLGRSIRSAAAGRCDGREARNEDSGRKHENTAAFRFARTSRAPLAPDIRENFNAACHRKPLLANPD